MGAEPALCWLYPLLAFPLQFFQTAAINVRDNVGEEVDPEQLIQETCRSCLEQVGTSEVLLGAQPSKAAWLECVPLNSFAVTVRGHPPPLCDCCVGIYSLRRRQQSGLGSSRCFFSLPL